MPKTLIRSNRAAVAAARPLARADEGIVVGIVAVTGHEDSVKDIIVPNAFARTLRERMPKLCWMHDWKQPLGRVLSIVELKPGDARLPKRLPNGKAWPKEAGAVVATMQFNLRTQQGREFFEHAKEWAKNGEAAFSIGYRVVDGMASKRSDGVRLIYALELYEVSLVLHGAHPYALALEVKSGDAPPGMEHSQPMNAGVEVKEAAAAVLEAKSLPKTQKCAKCSSPATKRIIHADGRAYQPTCDGHESAVKNGLEEVVATRPIEGKAAAAAVLEAKTLTIEPETKSMPRIRGSYEERRSLLTDSLESLLTPRNEKGDRDAYLCIDATFDDYVIVTVSGYGNETGQSWKVPYAFDGDAVTLGKAKEVELTVVVQAEQPKEVEKGEAVRMRFIDPATALIGDATRFLHASPEREGKSAGDGLEGAVLDLMDALIVKGYNVAAAATGGTDDMWDDDEDMPSEHDRYTGQRKGFDEDAAEGDPGPSDDEFEDEGYSDEPDDDEDDSYEGKSDDEWGDDEDPYGYGEGDPDDVETKGDDDEEAEDEGDTVTIDPAEHDAMMQGLRG